MKIEFLYKDDTYKSVIDGINESLNLEENEIIYVPSVQVGLNIFSFSKDGDNETTAKKLDEIKTIICKSLDCNKLFVMTDGVSNYFCQRLYPLMADFERGLRKVLYIASIKSKNENAIDVCRQIEEKEFAQIYQILFSDSRYLTEARQIVNSKTPELSKHDILKQLSTISESTLWNKLFNDQYCYIPENFLAIKNGRNKVMHSRDISFEDYSAIKNHLDKSNKILQKIEFDLLEKESSTSYSMIDSIIIALAQLGQAVEAVTAKVFSSKYFEEFAKYVYSNCETTNMGEEPSVNANETNTEKEEKELCPVS